MRIVLPVGGPARGHLIGSSGTRKLARNGVSCNLGAVPVQSATVNQDVVSHYRPPLVRGVALSTPCAARPPGPPAWRGGLAGGPGGTRKLARNGVSCNLGAVPVQSATVNQDVVSHYRPPLVRGVALSTPCAARPPG